MMIDSERCGEREKHELHEIECATERMIKTT